MKWVLLFVEIISPTDFDAFEIGRYDSMISCFNYRDYVLQRMERYDGIPEVNTQLVCIRTEH